MIVQENNQKIDERLLHELLNEVDLNKNGEIELAEFFQVSRRQRGRGWLNGLSPFQLYSGIKGGQVSQNRLVRYLDEMEEDKALRGVARSGGGL